MDTIKINSKTTKMVAHRGVKALERENTCPAFIAAGNRSYFGIETDVHVTKDKKFVIIHDETTARVTLNKTNINVEENDFSAVENLVLPDLDETTVRRDIRVPLLAEYISICKKYEKYCVLELKNAFIQEDIEAMLQHIRDMEYLDKVIFISFDLNNCIILRKLLPESEIQYLMLNVEITEEILKTLCDYRLNLDINYLAVNEEMIQKLHDKGILINCWTCDDKEYAEKLVDMGVDYITSNCLE